ncbi:hypothetical protein SAMN05444483_103136 [Salegentibacter echinorum]|uniref:Pyridoxal phosphate homeostasis protein n=1 Tax=Salegentibacter echinorum TaxID=1073325 RepID=A0A1M5FD09_SALEC|nr:YggS family pyridoxal phosphate-dependent enzyme [Salegentibacter echinorum]SHF89404.1 hypothetical protein SAMN05444483_103136 [Salegentibacter echinorum]
MDIKENVRQFKNEIPEDVTLVAISKTKPVEDLLEAYDTPIRHFGENKIQEMTEKYKQLPNDIKWHMVGHVQRNKVKYMAPFVHLVHAVDSLKLLKEINKQAKKCSRSIDCLLQIKIAEEDSKYGISAEEAEEILNSDKFKEFENVKVKGLMGMATFTDDKEQVKKEFQHLKSVFDDFKEKYSEMSILSMGMSGDYKIALECGSNMLRIGSSLFGARD